MALSVIGAGLGRTGTLSLKLALERLGFDRCYHMKEVFEHLDHVPVWDRAADGDAVDWDALFTGYHSAVDFPVASFHRELADHYPDAKLILTVRDPNRWYQSVSETIFRVFDNPLPGHFTEWGEMVRKTIVERTFAGNVSDRDHLIASYERHNEAVRRDQDEAGLSRGAPEPARDEDCILLLAADDDHDTGVAQGSKTGSIVVLGMAKPYSTP